MSKDTTNEGASKFFNGKQYYFDADQSEIIVFPHYKNPHALSITIQSKARGYDEYHLSQASGVLDNDDERVALARRILPLGYHIVKQG